MSESVTLNGLMYFDIQVQMYEQGLFLVPPAERLSQAIGLGVDVQEQPEVPV